MISVKNEPSESPVWHPTIEPIRRQRSLSRKVNTKPPQLRPSFGRDDGSRHSNCLWAHPRGKANKNALFEELLSTSFESVLRNVPIFIWLVSMFLSFFFSVPRIELREECILSKQFVCFILMSRSCLRPFSGCNSCARICPLRFQS